MKKNGLRVLLLCLTVCLLTCLCAMTSYAEGSAFKVNGQSVTTEAGKNVTVSFTVTENSGIAGLNVKLDYPEELTLVKVENKMTSLTYTAGKTLLWDGSNNTTYTGDLIVATFAVPSDATLGTEYSVKLNNQMCCDKTLKDVTYTASNATINVGNVPNGAFSVVGQDVTGYAGKDVSVTFKVTENSGIAGLNAWLDYSEALTLVKVENKMTSLTYTAGKTLLWDGSNNTTYTGDLIVATFAVPSDATLGTEYSVKLKNQMCCDKNLQDVTYTSSDATVTVVCGHGSTEVRNAKSATCTVKGYTGDTYCKICNQKIATGTDISVIAHTYNQQVATATYLKSAATCTAKAQYYYSCDCGAKGTTTFESGSMLAHTYNQQVATATYLKSAATCTAKAQYYYSCTCGAKGTTTFESGSMLAHTYNKKVSEAKYLKSAATCTAKAQYYYSCACGAIGTTTFEYGKATAHIYDRQVTTDTYLKSAATCTAKAKYYYSCVCGAKGTSTFESGDKLAHTFTQKNTNSKYLASAASCTAKALYYYSCTCGEKGTATFEDGEMLPHSYTQKNTGSAYLSSAATCVDKARYYYSCTCGAKGTETFETGSLAAHTIVTDPAVPATTISSGLTEGSHCSFCGKVLVEQQVIAAKDATPVEADVEEGKATVESVDVNKAKESVVIDFSAEKDAVTEVVLDKKTVEAIKSFATDKASTLDIMLRAAAVSLDAATVNTISSVNADTVSLTVDKPETKDLTEKQQATLQNEQVSEVISINLTAGNTEIHDLGGGKIQVTVPFTPKEGTDVKDYIVMYISEDGTTEIRTVVGTADGTLSFETSTCSMYAIVYRPPVKATVSLTNTDFNTAWGLDFTTEIKANQTSGTGASFTLMFDPLYVTLKSYKAANGVTVVKGENSLTVSTSNRVTNGSTLVTLTFTTSEYVTSGEHVYLSLKSGTNNTSSFGKLKIYDMGDVNMDGKVNTRDALMIKQAAVKMIKLTAVQMAYADVYVDSNANTRDALLISQSVVHMKVTLGDRVTLSFENGADTVLRSVHSGATLTSIPTLATGYKWSLSKSSMKLPNFVGITQNLVLYARKVS